MFRSYSESICRTGIKTASDPDPVHEPFKCDLCDEDNWLTETDVELHRKLTHRIEISKQVRSSHNTFCHVCMQQQLDKSSLIQHVKSRHLLSSPTARRIEREIFICHHCQRIFFNKHLLQSHMMHFHLYNKKEKKVGKKFICPLCGKKCKFAGIWFHFTYSHDVPSVTMCDICLTNAPSSKDLMKHLKKHACHYKCEICGLIMVRDFNYESHIDKHHATKFTEKPFGDMLDRVFKKPGKVLATKYNIHDSLKGLELPKPFMICVLCREICVGRNEARIHLLRDHLQSTQPPPQEFTCSCGAVFCSRVLLKQHVFKMKGTHRRVDDDPIPTTIISIVQSENISELVEATPSDLTISGDVASHENEQLNYELTEVEVECENMVTADSETNEQVIGF